MTLYLGKVSCDLHKCASRVRISCPGTHGIPLSVKASLNNYPRHLFKKDVTVEVEQCKHDGRKFRVTRVFETMKKPVNVVLKIGIPDAEMFKRLQAQAFVAKKKKDQPMEKVKFYLNANYFDHPEMKNVLNRTLGILFGELAGVRYHNRGLTLICTTDQFARFLIDRNLNGIKNGFMDLNAKLVRPEPKPDAYQTLADAAGVTRDQAKKMTLALFYSSEAQLLDRMESKSSQVDVSDR